MRTRVPAFPFRSQGQIGNPEGEDKPNKKKYDPRAWLREAEKSMVRTCAMLHVHLCFVMHTLLL